MNHRREQKRGSGVLIQPDQCPLAVGSVVCVNVFVCASMYMSASCVCVRARAHRPPINR